MQDGSDYPAGPRVPIPNFTGNTRTRDAIGSKADNPSNLATASVLGHLKWIEGAIGAGSASYLNCHTEMPDFSYVDASIVFAISVVDAQLGTVITAANLTAGKVDVIRIRSGVESTITSGASLSKVDGILYLTISLAAASWALDDVVKIVQNTVSKGTIGIITYDVLLIPQTCMLLDLGDISTQLDSMEADIDTILGYLDDGGRIDLLLDSIITLNTLMDLKLDAIYGLEEDIYLDTQSLTKGMINAENIDMMFISPNMPNADIGYSVNDLIGAYPTNPPHYVVMPTCTIERYRIGVDPGWTAITAGSTTESGGRVFYTYNFPSVNWKVGDYGHILFNSASIIYNGKSFTLPKHEMFFVVGLGDILQDLEDGGRIDLMIDDLVSNMGLVLTALGDMDTKIDSIQADVDGIELSLVDISDKVDDILEDTDELQEDWTDGGRLDLLLDNVDDNTQELHDDWEDGGRLDLILDAVKTDTTDILDFLMAQSLLEFEDIAERVNAILSLTEHLKLISAILGEENYLFINDTDKIKGPVVVRTNLDAMIDNDKVFIKEVHRMEYGGPWIQVDKEIYEDADGGFEDGTKASEWEMHPNRWGSALILSLYEGSPNIDIKAQVIAEEEA